LTGAFQIEVLSTEKGDVNGEVSKYFSI